MNSEHKPAAARTGSHLAGSVYDGSSEGGASGTVSDVISAEDRTRVREWAKYWRDLAAMPVMADRKRQWAAVHDLRMERPMILMETSSIQGFVEASELQCLNPLLRAVERNMRDMVRHAEEVGDDLVVEPYYRIGWQVDLPGFGVPVEMKATTTMTGESSLGYFFNFPITSPEEIAKLHRRSFGVIYYGCCEPLQDRLDLVMAAIPNLRSVSVSGWADFQKIGDMLGNRYVYSRKPTPAFLSGQNPQWNSVEADMKKTRAATKNCNVEILFRDLYTIAGDRRRLRKWVEMTKSIFEI